MDTKDMQTLPGAEAGTVKKVQMPPLLTVSPSPHIRGPENIASIMLDVLLALTPAMLWGIYVFGMRALALAVISVVCAIGWEAASQVILKQILLLLLIIAFF